MTILRPIMAGLLISTATAAYSESVTVKEVDVISEMSDVQGKAAENFYPEIEADLEAAVTERLTMDGENGHTVKVRLTEMSLDGNPMTDGGFNKLGGWVYVYPPVEANEGSNDLPENQPIDEFNIELDATAMGDGIQPGTVDFYVAMIGTFAKSAGERIGELDVQPQ